MSREIRIQHMSSFSRCGETLLLRCLNAHPAVHVVHNLKAPPEPKEDFALFRLLQGHEPVCLDRDHPLVQGAGVRDEEVLVVKNAVWEHAFPFEGFVLARNPFSVTESFKIFVENEQLFAKHKEQFHRWAKGIDRLLLEGMSDRDNLSCLCALYNRKMFPLARSGLPIVHYENFVRNPEPVLRFLIDHMELDWHDDVLNSHRFYEEETYGHGGLPMWKPIHADSLDKYKRLPKAMLSRVYGLTMPTMSELGYSVNTNFDVQIAPSDFEKDKTLRLPPVRVEKPRRTVPPAPRILFIGDSHAKIFEKTKKYLPAIETDVKVVKGATARGLSSKESKRAGHRKILEFLEDKPHRAYDVIFLQFGEIDNDFISWKIAARDKKTVEDVTKTAVDNYINFAEEHIKPYGDVLCFTSAVLPTIDKNAPHYGQVATERASVTVPLKERTDITLFFNRYLQSESARRGFDYIDASNEMLDPQKGLICPEFKNPRPEDHYHSNQALSVWLGHIRRFIYDRPGDPD